MTDFSEGRQMQTVIRNQLSGWTQVTSRIRQGSMLAWIMFFFFTYINDLMEGVDSHTIFFAGDAKMRRVEKGESCRKLQEERGMENSLTSKNAVRNLKKATGEQVGITK